MLVDSEWTSHIDVQSETARCSLPSQRAERRLACRRCNAWGVALPALVTRTPTIVGGITLAAGALLVAAPRLVTSSYGLEGEETAVRLVGLADLALVPGLLAGRPRWPWMIARAAVNLAQGAYLRAVADRSSSPRLVRGMGTALAGLTLVDAPVGLALRRAGR